MAENRVVQGRMVTPKALAELIHDGSVMEVDAIEDGEDPCPTCGGDVIEVVYMPSVTELRRGRKCQSCDWRDSAAE